MVSVATKTEILERKRGGCVDGILIGITHGFIGIESQRTQTIKIITGIPPPSKQSFRDMDYIASLEPLRYASSETDMKTRDTTYTLPEKIKHVVVFDWKVFNRKGKNITS